MGDKTFGESMGFVTKDSGERQQFTSGMQRDTQKGKTLFHLVYDGPLFKRWAELLTRGAEKYNEGNWMKANGPDELRRFKASAARHFAQWYYDETDEDHAAAVTFNINGAEYVKGKINPIDFSLLSNMTDARALKVNKAQPEEVSFDEVHARLTQDSFNQNLPYTTSASPTALESFANALTVEQSKALADKVLYGYGETKVGIDFAKEDGDRAVYVVGGPSKRIFVVPEDLRRDFENIMLAKDGEAVAVNDATLDLIRFNGIPVVYTDNLGASPLDPSDGSFEDYLIPVDTAALTKPAFNGVTTKFRFDIPDEPTPFIDLIRQRMFEAQLANEEWHERAIWSVPDFAGSCSGDPPFNFIQRLLIKLQDFYQDLKTKLAEKLLDIATDLDPYVVGAGK